MATGLGSMSESANKALIGPLDLDAEPVRARDSVRARQVILRPSDSNLDNDLEFKFTDLTPFYKQLESMRLYIKGHIVRGDSAPIDSMQESVLPVNLIGPSLFSAVIVELQNIQSAELSTTNFHYKNYLEVMLSFGGDALRTHLPLLGFSMDTPGLFDYIANENEGATVRRNLVRDGRQFEVVLPILNDFLRSRQELHPDVPLKITMMRSPARFCLMVDEDDIANDYRIKIDEATLTVNYIENNDKILKAHDNLLRTKALKMQMARTQIKNFDIARDLPAKQILIHDGILPQLVIVGFVSSAAYNGAWDRNPYFFHHYNLRDGCIKVNGDAMPMRRYRPKFGDENAMFYQEYVEFLANIGMYFNDGGCLVTPDLYRGGCFLMAFDLTSDRYVHIRRPFRLYYLY